MLIPRFTIRWLLLITTACSLFFFVFGLAARGQLWAIAFSIAVASIVCIFLAYLAVFAASHIMGTLLMSMRAQTAKTPFADAGLPPQIIPPEEPDS